MKRRDAFEKQNREAARLILQDPAKHGGEEALLVRWARLVLKQEGETRADRREEAA